MQVDDPSPDECTAVYRAAHAEAQRDPKPGRPCSTAAPENLTEAAGDAAPSAACPPPLQQEVCQSSELHSGLQKAKRAMPACKTASGPCSPSGSGTKRQRTTGVLRDADINTIASQDSTEAMQTLGTSSPNENERAEAVISATQLTVDTRQRQVQAAQEDWDSQDNSENVECTPQSSRCWQRIPKPSAPAPGTHPQAEAAVPLQEAATRLSEAVAQLPEAAGGAAGSPAWQVKSRGGQDSAAEQPSGAAAHNEMSLHLSQLQRPPERKSAAPPETAGRPNPFNTPAQRGAAPRGLPPPKWNHKQRGSGVHGDFQHVFSTFRSLNVWLECFQVTLEPARLCNHGGSPWSIRFCNYFFGAFHGFS